MENNDRELELFMLAHELFLENIGTNLYVPFPKEQLLNYYYEYRLKPIREYTLTVPRR